MTCFSFEFHSSQELLKVALLLDLGELEPGSYRLPSDFCVVDFEHQKKTSSLKVWWGNTLQYFAVVWIATMLLWQKAPKKMEKSGPDSTSQQHLRRMWRDHNWTTMPTERQISLAHHWVVFASSTRCEVFALGNLVENSGRMSMWHTD